MRDEGARSSSFATKVCPRCGSELYADMSVCYECLYDFSRDGSRRPLTMLPAVPMEDEDVPDPGPVTGGALASVDGVGVRLRTADAECWVGVPEGGVCVGRAADNDIVLRSPAVSEHHLRLVPTPDGMEVHGLGSQNPARYQGHEVRGTVIAPYDDTLEVCGSLLTMTGPRVGAS